MSDEIYHAQVKALAQAAHGAGKLGDPQGRAVADNPLCGDRVSVDVRLAPDGSIAALSQDVRGCLLCQAAASGLAAAAPGLRPEQIADARHLLENLLRIPSPSADVFAGLPAFADFTAFHPVHRHKSRHDCVLLPFRAAEKALDLALRRQD
jgi:nitrogen fixation NifU-like protein